MLNKILIHSQPSVSVGSAFMGSTYPRYETSEKIRCYMAVKVYCVLRSTMVVSVQNMYKLVFLLIFLVQYSIATTYIAFTVLGTISNLEMTTYSRGCGRVTANTTPCHVRSLNTCRCWYLWGFNIPCGC